MFSHSARSKEFVEKGKLSARQDRAERKHRRKHFMYNTDSNRFMQARHGPGKKEHKWRALPQLKPQGVMEALDDIWKKHK